MAGPSRTCCVNEYCTGVLHNEHPPRLHYLRPISVPFTKNAEEPNFRFHLKPSSKTSPDYSLRSGISAVIIW